ncbi:MAG TPA: histidinol phosphatase [Firmicutes bacterium]|nr:histidinol phosphatase [Bacillota bacterium]
MRQDYHTHTFRCQHAQGDVMDYAAVAAQKGLHVLGVTDHTPLPQPFPNSRWMMIRMGLSELDSYDQAIENARLAYPELNILKGMECEYSAELLPFYREELLAKRKFDYLILGNHFFPSGRKWIGAHSHIKGRKDLIAFAKHTVAAMATGVFAFIAHPDLFGNSYELWDEHTIECTKLILDAAVAYHVPLEINAYGLRKEPQITKAGPRPPYPLAPFWELAATYPGVRVVVNSDAHQPADVGEITAVEEIRQKYGLQLADLSYLGEK